MSSKLKKFTGSKQQRNLDNLARLFTPFQTFGRLMNDAYMTNEEPVFTANSDPDPSKRQALTFLADAYDYYMQSWGRSWRAIRT